MPNYEETKKPVNKNVGDKLVERLNSRMKALKCPVTFIEVESGKPNKIVVKGSYTTNDGKVRMSRMGCPNQVAGLDQTVNSIASGFYNAWKNDNDKE